MFAFLVLFFLRLFLCMYFVPRRRARFSPGSGSRATRTSCRCRSGSPAITSRRCTRWITRMPRSPKRPVRVSSLDPSSSHFVCFLFLFLFCILYGCILVFTLVTYASLLLHPDYTYRSLYPQFFISFHHIHRTLRIHAFSPTQPRSTIRKFSFSTTSPRAGISNFSRAPSLNDSPLLMDAMAAIVSEHLDKGVAAETAQLRISSGVSEFSGQCTCHLFAQK